MNPDYNEATDAAQPTKKRKASRKDNDEEGSKKRSKKSKSSSSLSENLSADTLLTQASIGSAGAQSQHTNNGLFTALSPPPSDDNSDELENLITAHFSDMSNDVSSSDDPLHLAIQGIKIDPPEWWSDSLTGQDMRSALGASSYGPQTGESDSNHPWAVNKSDIDDAIAALEDVDRLLFQNSPNPHVPE